MRHKNIDVKCEVWYFKLAISSKKKDYKRLGLGMKKYIILHYKQKVVKENKGESNEINTYYFN